MSSESFSGSSTNYGVGIGYDTRHMLSIVQWALPCIDVFTSNLGCIEDTATTYFIFEDELHFVHTYNYEVFFRICNYCIVLSRYKLQIYIFLKVNLL